jgi:hypothetical protein
MRMKKISISPVYLNRLLFVSPLHDTGVQPAHIVSAGFFLPFFLNVTDYQINDIY